jgi:hypothetical protein
MLQNNHPTANRTKALKETILRTTDRRILEIYKTTLPIREAFLRAEGHYNAINTHLQTQAAAPQMAPADIVASLCIKYMYFVRNKIAHAERVDYGFAFVRGSAEETQIRWLMPMLEALIIDLLNKADTF